MYQFRANFQSHKISLHILYKAAIFVIFTAAKKVGKTYHSLNQKSVDILIISH